MKLIIGNYELECSEPIEQMSKTANGKRRWLLVFSVKAALSAESVDALFSAENMQTLIFKPDDADYGWGLKGYTDLNSAYIRRGSDGTVSVELQAIKTESTPQTETAERTDSETESETNTEENEGTDTEANPEEATKSDSGETESDGDA